MQKDNWVYVGHMLDMAQKGIQILGGKNREEYGRDETMQFALIHLVQVIGEAAQHRSPEFRKAYPQVPWHEVIGMRNRIVHDYLNVDEDVIWEVVHHDLPPLIETLKTILPPDLL